MEITVGMFAQICVIILSVCAASLTLLDWHLTKKTVRTSARAFDMKGDRVFTQPDKPFVLDTPTFILADEDIRRVADVDEVLRRVRRDVSEKTDDAGAEYDDADLSEHSYGDFHSRAPFINSPRPRQCSPGSRHHRGGNGAIFGQG